MPTHWHEPIRARQELDGESFEDIESKGLVEWINGLREERSRKKYTPQPVRLRFGARVLSPEPGGGERSLSSL